MQIELHPDDALITPLFNSTPDMTRAEAHAEILHLLQRIPPLAELAAIWEAGADDDTVHAGPFTWTIFEYQPGTDPRAAALEWLDDYARPMRDAGIDVQIAAL